ncbi:MAG: tetratricopeptide repeat protein [Burkholderiales bacterium]|nr:tetratricopeptide repeat protein [Burkholderiales bacterium]
MTQGRPREAIAYFRKVLEVDPGNVGALNDLGACLADIGDEAEAEAVFDLAYSLDDTFVPVLVNRAKMLIEKGRSAEALPILQAAKLIDPQMCHIDAVYASYCMGVGEVAAARHYEKRAWLASFDKMRYANCYLFYSAYSEEDEYLLASEHRFWAETARDAECTSDELKSSLARIGGDGEGGVKKRLRIGYWSPDLRNHSVRYFFRPLLEGHDRSRVEIFVYHDGPMADAQTEHIRAASENFFEVFNRSDLELMDIFLSHRLDVLVELAGHSSHNRIILLRQRLAKVQITALGYPPTTGLASVDAKLLDKFIVNEEAPALYTERAVPLAESFWCFDPKEDAGEVAEPPAESKGFVTFGCVGNVAKISDDAISAWATILKQVPGSRLLLRSINFRDPVVREKLSQRLIQGGIDFDQVELANAEAGLAFFQSYRDIDIVLDTYPFNGGTTSCFAAYMGVPIVSLAGRALTSRMGASVLSNMGAPELIASDYEQYVRIAVDLATDPLRMRAYRLGARKRFMATGLGDGARYARQFEEVCKVLVEGGFDHYPTPHVGPIPEAEILRRAYTVLQHGDTEAASRIARYGTRHYPQSAGMRLLAAHIQATENRDDAAEVLERDLVDFSGRDWVEAVITLVRWHIVGGRHERARHLLQLASQQQVQDDFDRQQMALLRLGCLPQGPGQNVIFSAPSLTENKEICMLIPCDEVDVYDLTVGRMRKLLQVPTGYSVSYRRCDMATRYRAYRSVLQEDWGAIIILQKAAQVSRSDFFHRVLNALQRYDVIGIAGARQWKRIDWRAEVITAKAGGFLTASQEIPGGVEAQWMGEGCDELVGDMAVLDGALIAFQSSAIPAVRFDEELIGADYLLEEDWIARVVDGGARAAVHRNLGIFLSTDFVRDPRERAPGLMHLCAKKGFDPFMIQPNHPLGASVPFRDAEDALCALDDFANGVRV